MVWLLLAASLLAPLPRSNPDNAAPSAPRRFLELSKLLHEAGVAYGHRDVRGARTAFSAIVACCEGQNTAMTRWYSGFAEYGIASTSARLSDTAEARSAVLAALQSDYWSTDVIHSDKVLQQVVGASWLDSLMTCYETLRQLSESSWPKQPPLLILPHCFAPDTSPTASNPSGQRRLLAFDSLTPRLRDSLAVHRPLILALHGGNASYREFALHWRAVADSLNVAVLIPPGCVRYSAYDNSWDDDYNQCDGYLTDILDRYTAACGYTPETFVAGFSQGANAGIKYGFVHSDRIRGVIAVAGLLDQPLPPEMVASSSSAGLRIYAMSGEFETTGFLGTMTAAEKACQAGKLPFEFENVPGMAHEVPSDLTEHLQKIWPWFSQAAATPAPALN
jgi:predicted esterase